MQELWTIQKAFIESILWRRPDCITEETVSWFNEIGGQLNDYILEETLLRVATEPKHGFNADFLHKNLLRRSMPDRDATWSAALANMYSNEEENALNALINWAWDGCLDNVENERLVLCGTALTWLFTTSHRQLWDRATKALANLMVNRLEIAKTLIGKFSDVDDLYIHERLLAAVYGAVLNSKNFQHLPALAELVYEKVFKEEFPPLHILLRDYARGIIEVAKNLDCLPATIELKRVRPPYGSEWPLEIPSEIDLMPLVESHSYGIYSSTFHSDFNWYTINPVQNWSSTPLYKHSLKKSGSDYEEFVNRLFSRANKKGIEIFSEIDTSQTEVSEKMVPKIVFRYHLVGKSAEIEEERKRSEELENRLLSILPPNEAEFFRDKVKAHITYVTSRKDKSGFVYRFSKIDAAPWICKRAYNYGWTEERFGQIDKHMGRSLDQSSPVVERMGKKYQYLAYYELLARLSDNLHMMPDSDTNVPPKYEGPWQINVRDIDPSLLIRKTMYDGWSDHGRSTWWKPQQTILSKSEVEQRIKWLWSSEDIPSIEGQLIVKDPYTYEDCYVLDSFWKTREPNDGTAVSSLPNREVWLRIRSGLVRRQVGH